LAVALGAAALIAGMSAARAQGANIGKAPVVRNDVRGTIATRTAAVTAGDAVFRDEGVHTGNDSEAKVVFLDNTNLSLGPNSSVKLDKFVYAGPGGTGQISMNLARGAFRFVTGSADKRAYTINTPVATIGVRGTVLDISVVGARTTVNLVEGQAIVCPRHGDKAHRRRCIVLEHANDQAVITPGSSSKGTGQSPFQNYCSSTAGLCVAQAYDNSTQYAGGEPSLCGR
jgi:hypothetical protein